MPDENGKPVVTLLCLPESTASTLYGMFDVLESAGRDWGMLVEGRPGTSALRTLIVSADGRGRAIGNQLWMQPHASLATCPKPDVIAIPDLTVAPHEEIAGRYAAEVECPQRAAAHPYPASGPEIRSRSRPPDKRHRIALPSGWRGRAEGGRADQKSGERREPLRRRWQGGVFARLKPGRRRTPRLANRKESPVRLRRCRSHFGTRCVYRTDESCVSRAR